MMKEAADAKEYAAERKTGFKVVLPRNRWQEYDEGSRTSKSTYHSL